MSDNLGLLALPTPDEEHKMKTLSCHGYVQAWERTRWCCKTTNFRTRRIFVNFFKWTNLWKLVFKAFSYIFWSVECHNLWDLVFTRQEKLHYMKSSRSMEICSFTVMLLRGISIPSTGKHYRTSHRCMFATCHSMCNGQIRFLHAKSYLL